MAAGTEELTPATYIRHHLTFARQTVGESGAVHMDTLITSAILGFVVFGFLWWVVRGATAGVPGRRQAFVELCVVFVNDQVKSIFNKSYEFVAPLALTVFLWVWFMNAMDFLPIDWISGALSFVGVHEFRPVPTADLNATFALALAVWILMIGFAIKVKGLGGFIKELFCSPFGANPLLWPFNFLFNLIEYVSKPLSHSLRLFGNMYAGEIIFLLLWVWAATGLTGAFFAVILGWGWAIFHILIVTLQAFIFMMLTVVYISLAHEHH